MKLLAAAAVGAQAADLVTFLRMVATAGLGVESNPVAVALGGRGLEHAIAVKLLLVVFVVLVAAVIEHERKYLLPARVMLLVAIAAGCVGAGANHVTTKVAEYIDAARQAALPTVESAPRDVSGAMVGASGAPLAEPRDVRLSPRLPALASAGHRVWAAPVSVPATLLRGGA